MGFILVLSAVSVVLILIGWAIRRKSEWDEWETPIIIGIIIAIITAIFIAKAVSENVYKDLNTEVYRQKYDALTMQLDENYYNRITFDGRQSLINDIVSYNKSVIIGRRKHHSVWIGVLYPEDWDSLPLIDLKKDEVR